LQFGFISGSSIIGPLLILVTNTTSEIVNGPGPGVTIGNYINNGNYSVPCIQPVRNVTATCLAITCKPFLGGFICIPHGCNTDDRDLKDLCNDVGIGGLNQAGMTVHQLNSVTNYTQPLNAKPCDFVDLLPARHCCNEFCMSKGRVTSGTCDYYGNFVYSPDLSNVTTSYDKVISNKLLNGNFTSGLNSILNSTGKSILGELVNQIDKGHITLTGKNITAKKTGACFCQEQGTPDICNLVNQDNKGQFKQIISNGTLFATTTGFPQEMAHCATLCQYSPSGCTLTAMASDGVSVICICYCASPVSGDK